MKADSRFVGEITPSPNHDERAGEGVPDILLLHYTGMASGTAALQRLRDPQARVSSHYVVEEDGRIFQLVPEERRAWHAGAGSWMGRADINSRSIGIEIVNPGHEHGYRAFPPDQIAAVIELCGDCVERRQIVPQLVLAHSDIAPDRKQDPGELFPWDQLFQAGIGLYVPPVQICRGPVLRCGDAGADVARLQGAMAAFGYGVEPSGQFDERTFLAIAAFQRRFRPSRIDGVADRSTIETLAKLQALVRSTA